jgi:hypothetical protein
MLMLTHAFARHFYISSVEVAVKSAPAPKELSVRSIGAVTSYANVGDKRLGLKLGVKLGTQYGESHFIFFSKKY